MKRFILICVSIFILLGAIFAYVQLGPLRTVWGIQKSFRTANAELLNDFIDFDAVRESLKLQMRNHLNEENLVKSENPLLRNLYSSFSYNLIDGMVDVYLEPKSIQSLLDLSMHAKDKVSSAGNLDQSLTDTTVDQNWLAIAREYQALCDFKFISFSEFEVSLKENISEPVALALLAGTRINFLKNGINWRVNDIVFPQSFFTKEFKKIKF
tara:strand:+ start:5076 stop:5708 length:633 start_codon:yes stop_codon:yes gene_type:complete